MSEVYQAIGRFHYAMGLPVLRCLHRVRRSINKKTTPLRRQLTLLWRRVVTRRVRRVKRAWKFLLTGFPVAGRELAAAAKKNVFAVFPCFGNLVVRAVRRHKRHLAKLWVFAGPVAALMVFGISVNAWAHTDFCLSLTYRGQELGFIDNAMIFNDAAGMAIDRVVNVDNSFSVDTTPAFAIAIKGDNAVMDDSQLCDAILRTAGDSIAEATGLYVDGTFIGAMESASELNAVLDSLKEGRYDKNDTSQRAEFIQNAFSSPSITSLLSSSGRSVLSLFAREITTIRTATIRPITTAAITFLTPFMASGFHGMIFMRRPPVEKQRDAARTAAVPSGFIFFV